METNTRQTTQTNPMKPDETPAPKVCGGRFPEHDWVESYTGNHRMCRWCRKTERTPVQSAPKEPAKLPIGTPIRFLKKLDAAANENHPAIIYADKGETGTITGHNASEGYMVKTDTWPASFGAELGTEFTPVQSGEQISNDSSGLANPSKHQPNDSSGCAHAVTGEQPREYCGASEHKPQGTGKQERDLPAVTSLPPSAGEVPTPRTNAHEIATAQDLTLTDDDNVSAAYDFARQLERETIDLQRKLTAAKEEGERFRLAGIEENFLVMKLRKETIELQQQLAAEQAKVKETQL